MLAPLVFHGQRTLTGLWMGAVSNDSSTVRKDQSFEMALTQYREKVYGYSRTTFIVNDTLYYILKRVKGNIENGVCEIKDDEFISYNFPGRIDKGVKVTTTFRLNKADTTWHLDGNWSTKKTKNFYAITGKVQMREETDASKSKIYSHLEELNLDKEIDLEKHALASAGQDPNKPENRPHEVVVSSTTIKDVPANKQSRPPVEKKLASKKSATTVNENPLLPVPAAPVVAAAYVSERRTVISQEVLYVSDSLELSLYDNGEIDGDTVSILLNGELILSKELLKASAIRKKILTPIGKDEFTLVLYAENLGKYPPNTGLLVVRDGDQTYQIRFSADLTQNAAIIFRRKK